MSLPELSLRSHNNFPSLIKTDSSSYYLLKKNKIKVSISVSLWHLDEIADNRGKKYCPFLLSNSVHFLRCYIKNTLFYLLCNLMQGLCFWKKKNYIFIKYFQLYELTTSVFYYQAASIYVCVWSVFGSVTSGSTNSKLYPSHIHVAVKKKVYGSITHRIQIKS